MKIKKTPTMLQIETVECGAVSLGIILAYHGKYLSNEELRVECSVNRNGSNALNIVKVAKKFGLDAKGFRASVNQLAEKTFPAIIFWKRNHFIVLEGIKNKKYYVNDPASGHRVLDEKEFSENYSEVIICFQKTSAFVKSKKSVNEQAYLIQALKKIPKQTYLFICISGFILSIIGLIIPAFNRIFIDMILIPQKKGDLKFLLLFMFFTAIVFGITNWLYEKTLLRLKIEGAVQNTFQFIHKILRLPGSFYEQRYSGSIVNCINSTDNVSGFVVNDLLKPVVEFIFSGFYLLLMFYYNVNLSILSLSLMLLNMFLVHYTSKLINEEYTILFNDENKLYGIALAGINSIETLKANGQENNLFLRLAEQYTLIQNRIHGLNIKQKLIKGIPAMSELLSVLMLLFIGGLKIMEGSLSIGTFIAFQTLMVSFYKPLQKMINTVFTYQMLKADQKRLEDIYHYPEDKYLDRKAFDANQFKKLSGRVEIKNLSFTYDKLEEAFISDFNLVIEPGKRIALVGYSGSGKSTIGKLIAGLLQPVSGEILFDNMPAKDIPLEVIQSSLAYAEQEVNMFSGSIKDNITLWNEYIDEEALIKSAKDACLHDEVTLLKDKYETILQENGRNLSGGIRQRLEIARCLYSQPSILILDEATSAVDSKTEAEIDLNLRKRGCTSIVISHRLSTIRDCDEIIVLSKGKVVQRGKHEDLIKEQGLYTLLTEV